MGGMSISVLPKDELHPCGELSEPKGYDHTNVHVAIKEENEDDFGVEECGAFSLSGSKMEVLVPKPLEKLLDLVPPPFLTKTYEMVENPKTEEIVSWGEDGVSFVVWDPYNFSTHLLPKFFKHSNFSSFVRQLNTYGFKKVHLERWEFANVGFQRGKRNLLKTIKRKRHSANNSTKLQLQKEVELEKLKQQQEALKVEIRGLKEQQLKSDMCLAVLKERMKSAEWKQKEFVLLLAKLMKRTPLFQQLLQTYRQKKALGDGQVFKKCRLDSNENAEDSFLKGVKQKPECCQKDEMVGIHLEGNSFLDSSPVGLGRSCMQEQKSSLTSETSRPDLSSGNYIMWEKLMEDDVICKDDEEDVFAANQTKFVDELEDLIVKPSAWGSLGNVS